MNRIVFNHATVRKRAEMLTFLRLCAGRGLDTVSIWGDEIDKVGEAEALAVLRDHGMAVSGYNRIGPLTPGYLAQAEAELERAARFGADHVMAFTGGLVDGERDLAAARGRLIDRLGPLLEMARKIGVKLAVEPLHPMLVGDRTIVASLNHGNDLCEALGPGIGLVVDVYHVWWDERLQTEIARAGRAGRLLGFHVNDWLVPTKHILTDRGMMGDGIINLAAIHRMMCGAGFDGPIEVEIFSAEWWARDPAEVLDIALARCEQIFAPANAASAPASRDPGTG
jgi:sugar phosphate isomerase/epimerase